MLARAERLAALASATGRSASCGGSTSPCRAAASSSSPGRTAPGRRRCCGSASASPQPTEGTIERSAARAQVGYLGHEPLVYRELTALENLELYGRLYRVAERRERIGMLLERFGLWEARHERVASYSRGMTQRLALCRVLLHEPELLVLDEPYSALDEAGAELLDAQLAELRGERTFLLATHDPARVEPLASGALALAL